MAIRSMAPKVIVADEIGNMQDSEAIKYAVCCGVKGIFTAHGNCINDLILNPELKDLILSNVFERIIIIKDRNEKNIYTQIYAIGKNNYECINTKRG